uniref:Uncharacterized protein n=1 Tax=Davidia involucrata TaxID=16924 RepID=A0A5B6ZZP9_DAVIN
MYKRFLALPHPGLAIYRNCIELELNLASAGYKDSIVKARKLYESALTTYDQDVSLWRDYYSMEIKKQLLLSIGVLGRCSRTMLHFLLLQICDGYLYIPITFNFDLTNIVI